MSTRHEPRRPINPLPWIASALSALAVAGAALAAPDIGKPAPNFSLPDTNGNQHALADRRGKLVVLEWTNHRCPFVRKHHGSANLQSL